MFAAIEGRDRFVARLLAMTEGHVLPEDHVAEMHLAGANDPSGDAAVAADCVVAAGTKGFLHPGAWVALAGCHEERRSQDEVLVFERVQVDAGHDDVAAQPVRIDGAQAEISGDGGEVFGLDEGDLPRLVGAASVVVADKAVFRVEIGMQHRRQRPSAAGTKADPPHDTGAHRCVQQAKEG